MAKLLKLEQLQEDAKVLVKDVIQGRAPGVLLLGSGGTGKSHCVTEAFDETGRIQHILNTHASPLALYSQFYEVQEQYLKEKRKHWPIFKLEDMEGVYKNEQILGLLRSAVWSDLKDHQGRMIRTITWTSTSEILEKRNIPQSYEFKGGVILLANKLPANNAYFDALLTRFNPMYFDVENDDVFDLIEKLVRKRRGWTVYDPDKESRKLTSEDCQKVIDYLRGKNVANIRAFEKGLTLYTFHRRPKDTWKRLLDRSLEFERQRQRHSPLEVISELEGQDISPEDRIRLFKERTGMSQATYYRMRKTLN